MRIRRRAPPSPPARPPGPACAPPSASPISSMMLRGSRSIHMSNGPMRGLRQKPVPGDRHVIDPPQHPAAHVAPQPLVGLGETGSCAPRPAAARARRPAAPAASQSAARSHIGFSSNTFTPASSSRARRLKMQVRVAAKRAPRPAFPRPASLPAIRSLRHAISARPAPRARASTRSHTATSSTPATDFRHLRVPVGNVARAQQRHAARSAPALRIRFPRRLLCRLVRPVRLVHELPLVFDNRHGAARAHPPPMVLKQSLQCRKP